MPNKEKRLNLLNYQWVQSFFILNRREIVSNFGVKMWQKVYAKRATIEKT